MYSSANILILIYINCLYIIVVYTVNCLCVMIAYRWFFAPTVETNGFLFPLTLQVHLKPEDSLFFFINETIPSFSASMGSLYEVRS